LNSEALDPINSKILNSVEISLVADLIRIQVKYIEIKNHTLGNNNGLLKLKEYVSAQNDASQTAESSTNISNRQYSLSALRSQLLEENLKNRQLSPGSRTLIDIVKCCLNEISNSELDALTFWKKVKPEWDPIRRLALNVLCVPATSAPIERAFSQCGFATRHHRANASMELINNQMIVYMNSVLNRDLFDDCAHDNNSD
jgi:hypothetical protein